MPTLSNKSRVILQPPHAAVALFDVALVSDVGMKRENNEDAAAVHPSGFLYLVADGMGGHERGEVAATTAARAVARFARPPAPSLAGARAALAAARAAVARVPRSTTGERPGCAAVVASFDAGGESFSVAWAGDCRAYHFRPSETRLRAVTEDQHVGGLQHVLSNALMAGEANGADDESRGPEVMQRGDVLLLATDGLHGYVKDSEIRHALLRSRAAREVCEAMVGLAYAAKAPDNVTVLCIVRR